VSSAGSGYFNTGYSDSGPWWQMSACWEWNAAGDPAIGSLIIQARIYSSPSTDTLGVTDIWFDLVEVDVPNYASVRFPDFGPTAVENSSWGGIKALYR
jgi:hypothetical protein